MASEPYLGAIFMFAGTFAPVGYELCQGQLVAISQNSALYSLLGTTFGGDGRNTFALPDLQGRVPVGAGCGQGLSRVNPGDKAGSATVTLGANQMPAHSHGATITIRAAAGGRPDSETPAGSVLDSTPGTNTYASQPDSQTTMNANMVTAQIAASGSGQPVDVRNPYVGIHYIIATQGLYPSRP